MAQERLSVAIGSLNPVKINAVRSALVQARISADVGGVDVPSGVSAMPTGFAETMTGAQQRAALARATLGTDWGVGMEGGVEFDSAGDAWLFNVVAIATAARESLSSSGRLLLPPAIAAGLQAGAELGPLIDDLIGASNTKQGLGAVGYLTRGLITREAAFYDSFSRALAPLLHPDLYGH